MKERVAVQVRMISIDAAVDEPGNYRLIGLVDGFLEYLRVLYHLGQLGHGRSNSMVLHELVHNQERVDNFLRGNNVPVFQPQSRNSDDGEFTKAEIHRLCKWVEIFAI
jgi:hypothetical protein